jgi:hypothetical protein
MSRWPRYKYCDRKLLAAVHYLSAKAVGSLLARFTARIIAAASRVHLLSPVLLAEFTPLLEGQFHPSGAVDLRM